MFIFILTALLGFVSACTPPASDIASKRDFMKPCPGFAQTGKAPLVFGAECGELTVRENPDDVNSPELVLSVLRLPAISPVPAQDPLFLIQGGPGGSSIALAAQVHGYFADVRKHRDLVFVDQRGTGKSNPFACESLSEDDKHLTDSGQMEKYVALMRACAQQYQEQLPFYTTPYAVNDLDQVREALGYTHINVWGASYGTRVALEYARQYPQHARALVLDGVAPTSMALPKFFARDAMTALEAMNKACSAQVDCVAEYGDIVQQAEMIAQSLLEAQRRNSPWVVNFEHPRHQQMETLTITPRKFSSLVFSALYSRDLTVLLPRAINSAAQGDFRLLAALSVLASEKSMDLNISDAMHFSVVCNEDWHFISDRDVQQSSAFFGLNRLKDMAAVCKFWPKAKMPNYYWQAVRSDTPTLMLSGKYDPVTPALWADQVAETLSASTHLLVPGGNHIVSTEGCVPQVIAQFVEQGNMKNINTDCIQHIKPLPMGLGANKKGDDQSASSSTGSLLQ